jgi:RNA polymerase sigma-70 factor (ECF subfamily)
LADSKENIIEFTILFNRNKKKVFNYVLRMTNNTELSEDLVQNAFLKLYDNLNNIRNKSSIPFWLFKTARNEVYTYFRNNKRKPEYNAKDVNELEFHSTMNIESEFELKEMKELLLYELGKLPQDQKEIFILREYGGLSYKEISSQLEINIDLVKSRLYKTRQKLMKIFHSKSKSEVFRDE